MGDFLQLVLQSTVQIRVVVAVHIRPDGRIAIEVALPFPVDQPTPFAAHQVQTGVVLIFPHLGKRMPPEALVGGIKLAQGGRGGGGSSRHTPSLGLFQTIVKPELPLGLQYPAPKNHRWASGWDAMKSHPLHRRVGQHRVLP